MHRLERRCVSTHTNAHATCRAKRVDLSGATSASLNSLPLAAVCVSFALVSASVPHAVSAASTANSAPTARRVVARRRSGRICRVSHADVHASCAGGYVSAARIVPAVPWFAKPCLAISPRAHQRASAAGLATGRGELDMTAGNLNITCVANEDLHQILPPHHQRRRRINVPGRRRLRCT